VEIEKNETQRCRLTVYKDAASTLDYNRAKAQICSALTGLSTPLASDISPTEISAAPITRISIPTSGMILA